MVWPILISVDVTPGVFAGVLWACAAFHPEAAARTAPIVAVATRNFILASPRGLGCSICGHRPPPVPADPRLAYGGACDVATTCVWGRDRPLSTHGGGSRPPVPEPPSSTEAVRKRRTVTAMTIQC